MNFLVGELTGVYNFLLNLEGIFIVVLTLFFLKIYLKTFSQTFSYPLDTHLKVNKNILNKFSLAFLAGIFLGILIIASSWWPVHPLICAAIIFSLGTFFIHEAFTLAFFILFLFFRPWELISEWRLSVPEIGLSNSSFFTTKLASIPQIWVLLLLLSSVIHWKRLLKIHWIWIDLCVFSFVAWFLIPLLISGNQENLEVYWNTLFRAGVIYFLLRTFIVDDFGQKIQSTTIALVGFFLLLSSIALWIYVPEEMNPDGRLQAFGLFKNANDLAALIVFTLPFLFHSFKESKHLAGKLLPVGFALTSLVILWLTGSRGALLGFLGGTFTYAWTVGWLKPPSKTKLIFFIGLTWAAFKLFTFLSGRSDSDIHVSSVGRLNYWATAVRMFLHHPLWGVGFGNYTKLFESYTFEFFEFGERTAHSSLFLVLAEGGFVGFILFCMIIFGSISLAFKNRKSHPEIFSSMIGYFITMLFLSHSYLFFIYLLIALIVSIESSTTSQWNIVGKGK